MRFSTNKLARAGIIAALYTAASLVTFPIASGYLQLRLSEALTLLPLLFPESVFGVTVGCLLSNIITGCAPLDCVFGSLITLFAGALTFVFGKIINKTFLKIFVGGLFPVILNAVFLPLIWYFCYGTGEYVYAVSVLLLLASQSISVYVAGAPLYLFLKKRENLLK